MSNRYVRTLIVQFTILIGMTVVAIHDMGLYAIFVSVSFIILPFAYGGVAWLLVRASAQDPTIHSLADGADDAIVGTIASTVVAIVGIVVILRLLNIVEGSVGTAISIGLGFAVLSFGQSALRFLRRWRDVWMPMIHDRESG